MPGAREDGGTERQRRKLTRGQVFRLILATYATSFPYILLFVLVMLIATWALSLVFH